MKSRLYTLTAVFLVCSASLVARAQTSNTTVKDDLFAGTEKFAKNASDVEEITMDPDTLARVGGHDGGQARSMVLDVVRTYSYAKPGMYNVADVDEFRNKLNTGDWHCSVHISHPLKGESTDVCERRRADNMHESAIITVEPKQLTFIHKITREHVPGSQSWGSYPDSGWFGGVYPGVYSEAQARAEEEVAMAEMRASMAGIDFGFARTEFPLHLAMSAIDAEDLTRQAQRLQKDLKLKKETPANQPATSTGQRQQEPNTKQ